MPPFHIGVAELFQSTLPLRGATSPTRWNPRQSNFNPHSPCGERLHRPYRGRRQPISIHTPLAGSDMNFQRLFFETVLFQSTLPLRGATRRAMATSSRSRHFNPHSPCGERRSSLVPMSRIFGFQSTLPLRGATAIERRQQSIFRFQSTLPLRGATGHTRRHPNTPCYFNPHSPCGERPDSADNSPTL